MTNFLLSCIIQFVASVNTPQAKLIGLSPNGKATDSDSVIFKVRILVAQLPKWSGFLEETRDSGLFGHHKANDYKTGKTCF